MIFGFLLLDVLIWAVLPFILLLLLWGDEKGWAAVLTVLGIGAIAVMDWSKFSANITNPIWIGNVVKYVAIYCTIGAAFTFLKWKILASKAARSFGEFLQKYDMSINVSDVENSVKRSKDLGGVDAFDAEYEAALAEAKVAATASARDRAAEVWNDRSNNNTYREVLRVKNADGVWKTSYNKFELGKYVASWIIYWPFYAILLVLDDLIRHIADWFVEVFGKGYQKLADASFSHIE